MSSDQEQPDSPEQYFASLFRDLIDFRGPYAEAELYKALGEARIRAIYEGAEPSFSEFVTIAKTLNIPLTAFMRYQSGQSPEVELVIAEILYYAAQLDPDERRSLSESLLNVMRDHAGLPPTSITLLQLIDKASNG